MNRFFLFILMLPQTLWRKMGADTEQLKALLRVRLLLDGRRPLGMSFKKTTTHKKNEYSAHFKYFVFFLWVHISYAHSSNARTTDYGHGLQLFLFLSNDCDVAHLRFCECAF